MTEHDTNPAPASEPTLSPADARALDALVEAGFDPTRAPGDERIARAARLLSLLSEGISSHPSLADVTMEIGRAHV